MVPTQPKNRPIRAEAKTPKRERTRRKLIHAARALIYEKGAEEVTIQEVTQAAGLATGSFYNYFRNKRDMLDGIVEHFRSEFEQSLDPTRGKLSDPAMKLAVTLKYYFKQSQENNSWRTFMTKSGLNNEISLIQSEQQCLEDIRAGLRGGRFRTEDPLITQSLITAMTNHVCMELQKVRLSSSAINETVRHILRMLGLPDIAAKAFADAPLPDIPAPYLQQLPMRAATPSNSKVATANGLSVAIGEFA